MDFSEIINYYKSHSALPALISSIKTNQKTYISGLKGSAQSIIIGSIYKKLNVPIVIVLNDKEDAAYFYNDLQTILGEHMVDFLPSSFQRSAQYSKTESGNILLRTDVLTKIITQKSHPLIVTYPESLMEKVITPERITSNTFTINKGDKLSMEFVIELLTEYEFERTDFVYEPGQFAVRGSIIDVFSFAGDQPYRIDFFGDEVDSLRVFDIENQLTKSSPDQISIIPNIQEKLDDEERITLFEYLNKQVLYAFSDLKFTIDKLNQIYENTPEIFENEDATNSKSRDDLIISGKELNQIIEAYKTLETGSSSYYDLQATTTFNTSLQPAIRKNFDLLASQLNELKEKGYNNYILSDNLEQIERLQAIFNDRDVKAEFKTISNTLNQGFIDHDLMIACFTDHQIFERFHKFNIKSGFTKKESLTIAELTNLHPGDYVVHIDHGIGKFGGLQRTETNGKIQETIKLIYRDNDVLFVSIHSLHRISKYKGKEAEAPKVHKLGSAVWQNLKTKTKKKVKDIAKDLIKLYAERKVQEGYAFSGDSFMNQQLEASFIYEDTPDQVKATKAVKADMESFTPMDRLVCGDVGFGKTEIAIRAAFKAVADSKQVAVLVPTTILALQHYKTFSDRLEDFPCNVEYISRLRSGKSQTEVIKKLKSGEVDIIIGTHKLVSKTIEFKDLGLLIVDEEQKFGVALKEKLKQLKTNVDTLTLTATPIPRTLQFSLMGARDLSIINTPPPNRQPIITEVHSFSEQIIKEAIDYEISRNGQVFFIHNRVQSIADISEQIKKLCPNARVIFAHGQLDGKQLETIMLEFIDGKYDVLVATTIIESGLDIPNANTIIINQAQNYGLSDLHQLRGRVGRSNKKAFCYLLAPPPTSLTNEARRRLKAIEDFSELGSGFNISLQDLDIRGAGDMLGAEQSGFIGDLGFEAYQKILDEALLELKHNELKEVFADENLEQERKRDISPEALSQMIFVNDCYIDTDLELLFPESYVDSIPERINLYRKLDSFKTEEELKEFHSNLIDRFGELPMATEELLEIVRLRWLALKLGMERIFLKNNKMTLYFISDNSSLFYQSPTFQQILQNIQKYKNTCRMQEKNNKLILTFENVPSVKKALIQLTKLTVDTN
ncbi:MAG: transcription-repair coupling factor [Salinivirgaceae bacterium]|nr:transcription-repair coupling factor [Salinivirgaceae bacterium]